jgi:DNA (cytosine-5)-methyltransferase 1
MGWPRLVLNFNENGIAFGDVDEGDITYKQLSEGFAKDWRESKIGGSVGKFFSNQKVDPALVLNTIASGTYKFHWKYPRELTDSEFAKCGSYPLDYNFQKVEPKYLIGMSVPPVMTAQVAHQVYLQWLSKTGQKQGT